MTSTEELHHFGEYYGHGPYYEYLLGTVLLTNSFHFCLSYILLAPALVFGFGWSVMTFYRQRGLRPKSRHAVILICMHKSFSSLLAVIFLLVWLVYKKRMFGQFLAVVLY